MAKETVKSANLKVNVVEITEKGNSNDVEHIKNAGEKNDNRNFEFFFEEGEMSYSYSIEGRVYGSKVASRAEILDVFSKIRNKDTIYLEQCTATDEELLEKINVFDFFE